MLRRNVWRRHGGATSCSLDPGVCLSLPGPEAGGGSVKGPLNLLARIIPKGEFCDRPGGARREPAWRFTFLESDHWAAVKRRRCAVARPVVLQHVAAVRSARHLRRGGWGGGEGERD